MVSIQGVVYFGGNDGEHGDELWQSDGTVGGTRMISELVPGTSGGSPDALTTAAGALFFVDNAGSFYVYQP
jgi:ELWxxDGT repeat protein